MPSFVDLLQQPELVQMREQDAPLAHALRAFVSSPGRRSEAREHLFQCCVNHDIAVSGFQYDPYLVIMRFLSTLYREFPPLLQERLVELFRWTIQGVQTCHDRTHRPTVEPVQRPWVLALPFGESFNPISIQQRIEEVTFAGIDLDRSCPRCQRPFSLSRQLRGTPNFALIRIERSEGADLTQVVVYESISLTSAVGPLHEGNEPEHHRYRLSHVICHSGQDKRSGHYICLVRATKGSDGGEEEEDIPYAWCCNDELVGIMTLEEALSTYATPRERGAEFWKTVLLCYVREEIMDQWERTYADLIDCVDGREEVFRFDGLHPSVAEVNRRFGVN